MSYRDVARLAWSLLASLLLHLALVADIAQLHWPINASPANLTLPLEVRFFQASVVEPIPAPIQRHHSAPQPAPSPPALPEVIIPEPLPVLDKVISADLADAAQEPTEAVPPASQPDSLAAEPQESTSPRLPANGRLVYRFYWGKARWLAGHAIHEWVIADGYYTLSSSVVTTGLFALLHPTRLVETAKGLVSGDKLRPLQFSSQFNDYPPSLAFFNREKGYFRWFIGNASFKQPLPADSYDKISFLYQLYLAQDKDGLTSAYITTGRGLERYDIENLGWVELDIDGRIFPTIHLRKLASTADPGVIDVWLSTVHRMPVKITQATPAGYHFEQLIAPESMPVD